MAQRNLDRDLADKYRYLEFLYNATHPQEFCTSLPHQFFVESTNICNCRCEFCIQTKMKRPKGKMEFSLLKKIVDQVVFFDPYFDFCRQGEALLHPQITDMIEYAIRAGMTKTRLVTNGRFLREDLAQRIITGGLPILHISFNGYNRKSYERYQKKAHWEETMTNILEFLRLKYEMKSATPKIEISMVKYSSLAENQSAFFELFNKLPLDKIRINSCINFFGQNPDPIFDRNVQRPFNEWPTCKVPWRFFNINWDGDVTPCIVDYDGKYSAGNVNDERILDIWNNKKWQYLRKCHIEKKFDLIESKHGKFCDCCNELWNNPKDHGPQFPETFEQGAREFFQTKKIQAGRFQDSIIKSDAQIAREFKYFIANYEKIYDKIVLSE